MFDQLLQMVKEHFGDHPEISNLPADQQEALHNAIANHINDTANAQATDTTQATDVTAQQTTQSNGGGGILSTLENAIAGGGTLTSAIEGGLVGTLASKFGLSPSITGAISGALPGLLQKFMAKKIASQN